MADHVTTFLFYVDIAAIHPRAKIKYQDAFLPGNMQICPSTVLLLSQKIRMFGVGFFKRKWTLFSVSSSLSFAPIDLKCEPLKEIKESHYIALFNHLLTTVIHSLQKLA